MVTGKLSAARPFQSKATIVSMAKNVNHAFALNLGGSHFNSRARRPAMSRKTASNGVVLPRRTAPMVAGEKSFSGSARTFAGNGRPHFRPRAVSADLIRAFRGLSISLLRLKLCRRPHE
jgi:hypothetical protein